MVDQAVMVDNKLRAAKGQEDSVAGICQKKLACTLYNDDFTLEADL